MRQLRVEADRPYSVHIGSGVYGLFMDAYRPLLDAADRIVIIADERVAELHLHYLMSFLSNWEIAVFTIPSGENAKSVETFMACHSFLLTEQCSRNSILLAFGGGATGDVVGFVASTFMRGISFVQLPTTILAHDSAVGGKTAINHELGKNMIGTFYQPASVLYDSSLLVTLPLCEVRSGMAEVIKHAFISNKGWLDEILAIKDFKQLTETDLTYHLEKGIAVKAAIVEEDEFEGSVRKYLNFGHTLAHAIEGYLGYGKVTHGEAVVVGMTYALLLSNHHKLDEFIQWSIANSYPFHLLKKLPFEELLPYMKKDKKSSKGVLNFILLEQTGQPFVEEIDEKRARSAYDKLILQIGEVIS
ncbi:3-dehydroquinate synthase [Planococcus versutus]|uniref:3-dehydroquinate synthase n=1 Tax=Planococcus versutus TaxID=1302659 RepID=A0A1B1S4I3_9BACL|nr:3-dehydroquinate synthase [Planococcus versutus]ANU28098.1 3-dehydroquinate synthase [Planococcus versutus]